MKHGLFALFATLVLSSVALTACGDDDKSSSNDKDKPGSNTDQNTDACQNGQYACQFNNLVLCENNVWKQIQACGGQTCDADAKRCGSGENTNTPECTNGDYTCESNALMLCEKDRWTQKEACGEKTCDADAKACIDERQSTNDETDTITSETCTPMFKEYCDGKTAYFCDNEKVVKRDCTKTSGTCHVTTNDNGNYADCVEPCNDNTFDDYTTCSGDFVEMHVCLATTDGGTYDYGFTDTKCAEGCKNGACIERKGVTEGASCNASTCSDGNLYECLGGKYVLRACEGDTVCTMGTGASCTAKPKANATCDPSTFIDTCVGDTLYYCHSEKKIVTSMTCLTANGETCRYIAPDQNVVSNGYAECAIPCSEGTESLLQCVKTGDAYYTDNYYCLKGSDANWWFFPVQTMCEGDCKSGVCQ